MSDDPTVVVPEDNQEWEPITRAWLLINVEGVDKVELAKKIYGELNERYHDNEKIFVVRVDVVSGPFDLVAPVYTEDLADEPIQLEEIKEAIEGYEGVIGLETALVVDHVPLKTWDTQGFITYQEVNSPGRGSQGHSPW